MDPSPGELIALTSLDETFDWVGIDGAFKTAVQAALGEPRKVRELALVPRATWDAALARGTLKVAAADGSAADLTPIQEGRLESLRRVANLLCILPADDRPAAHEAAPGAPVGSAASAPAPVHSAKRVKLSSVIDQTCDAEVVPIDAAPLRQMYRDYKKERGGEPHSDAEASPEQIGAVQALLAADQVPYVDFAIFRPHARRLLRKLTFYAHVFDPSTNTFTKTELPGPPDLDTWWASWKVLRTILLFLHAVSTERLENYAEFIRELCRSYGPACWWIIYQADVRMRCEHMERIRRRLESQHEEYLRQGWTSRFRPIAPWDSVFEESVLDAAFWTTQVRESCVLYLAKVKTQRELADDGTAMEVSAPGARGYNLSAAAPPPPQPVAPRPPRDRGPPDAPFEDRSVLVDGRFTHNRRGTPVCGDFNEHSCGDPKKPHGKCPKGAVHQCNRCLGAHTAKDARCPGKPKGKGKGKGKKK